MFSACLGTWVLLVSSSATAALAPFPEDLDAIERRVAAGEYGAALAALEALPSAAGGLRRWKLHARCAWELRDYPRCETSLELALTFAQQPAERAELFGRLANALTFQNLPDRASKAAARAVELHDVPALRRVAIAVGLRARRYDSIAPHIEAVLRRDPRDAFARFARGIVRSRRGDFERAVVDLHSGFRVPHARRDARFESALALGKLGRHRDALELLLEILEIDPWDAEACYQASRQVLRARVPGGARTAARLNAYFAALRDAEGRSSTTEHLSNAGQAALAALREADRAARLNDHATAILRLKEASALAPESLRIAYFAARYWTAAGLLAEAEAALERARAPATDAEKGVSTALREALDSQRASVARAPPALATALGALATASWRDATPHLERTLRAALSAGDDRLADHTARILLAHQPDSLLALRRLVDRTAAPSLILPRLHYLARLVRTAPRDDRARRRYEGLRAALFGQGAEQKGARNQKGND